MLYPNATDISPPGARWIYKDPSGSDFKEVTLKNLLIAVRKHREGLILINPESDTDLCSDWQNRVIHEVCLQMQAIGLKCHPVDEYGRDKTVWTGLADVVRRWDGTKSNWESAGKPFVSEEEANRRAAICRSCVENKPIAGCYGCSGFAAEVAAWLSGMKTLKDDDLHTCMRCSCFLRAKVWMPIEVIDNHGADFSDLPWCWQNDASPIPSLMPQTAAL